MKIGKFLSAIAFLLLLLPSSSLAADFKISPLLIDVEAEARDIISKDITLTNESESKLVLYATVNEVAVDTTGEVKEFISPSMDDRTTAITSWIEITRGRIELEPKETKIIPLALRINPYAKPGAYNAFVGFVQTSKRPDAERIALLGDADGVIIKATLGSKSSDLLRIDSFLIDRFILNDTQRMITINVKNEGDTDVIPTGEIIFYNSRGEEVASAVVNNQSETVVAGETKQLTLAVPFHSELGRFKANVRLNYGADQKALVFDTTQFFMIPPFLAIAIVIGIIVFSVLVTYLIRRAFYDELHEEEDGNSLPLYVRNNRDHEEKDHDITIIKS